MWSKLDLKTTLIVALCVALLLCTDGCGYWGNKDVTEIVTTKIDTVYVEKIRYSNEENTSSTTEDETVIITKPDDQEDPQAKPHIEIVDQDRSLTPEEEEAGAEIQKVKKLTDIATLDNGTITSEILYKGEILKTSYKLQTNTPVVTKTVEIERTVNASGLFGYVGTTVGLSGTFQSLATGIEYVHKNRWIVGTGLRLHTDPTYQTAFTHSVGVDFKLSFRF